MRQSEDDTKSLSLSLSLSLTHSLPSSLSLSLPPYPEFADKTLDWFKPYLTDRQQQTFVNGHQFSSAHVKCGVPQGSILVPLLFLINFSFLVVYNIPLLECSLTTQT